MSLNAIPTNLELFLGEDHDFVCTETDAADMTGWALSCFVKALKDDDDAEAKIALVSPTQITIVGAVATISFRKADTVDQAAGTYYWELKRMDSGAETVVGFGRFRLLRGLHRT